MQEQDCLLCGYFYYWLFSLLLTTEDRACPSHINKVTLDKTMANEIQSPKAGASPTFNGLDQALPTGMSQQDVADYIQDVSLQLHHLAKSADLEMLAHLFGMIVVESRDPRRSTH